MGGGGGGGGGVSGGGGWMRRNTFISNQTVELLGGYSCNAHVGIPLAVDYAAVCSL